MLPLNLGCGQHKIEGFLNCDIKHISDEDFLELNVENTFPFDNNSVPYIYSCHLIEHLTYDGFKNYLVESFRCLKTGGVHRICFPSLDRIKDMINNTDKYKDYIKKSLTYFNKDIYKSFDKDELPLCFVINNLYHNWGHVCIYDVNTIIKLCESIGYKNVKEVKLNESEIELFKNIELTSNRREYVLFKQYESSVIECVKL